MPNQKKISHLLLILLLQSKTNASGNGSNTLFCHTVKRKFVSKHFTNL